jgi:hypothetical protein
MMLKLRLIAQTALVTIALCTAAPVLAQQGAGERIEAAGKQLDADIKACKPINPADYKALVDEANRNVKAAKAAAKAGAPVDITRLTSDLEKANALLKRAQTAAANPCPPPQQQPQPPKQAPAPPKPVPVQPGQVGGGIEVDPWTALNLEAWGLFEDLDDAIWYCDIDEVKRLIPELEDLLNRARQVANTAKAAGKFSKVNADQAQKLVESIQAALDDAKSVKACPLLKESTTTPKPSTGKSEKPGQPSKPGGKGKSEKSSLNDLFGPQEKPTPPKHSIVEDLVEPPSTGELKILNDALKELGELGKAMKGTSGCDPKAWEAHVKRLELIAKRTRQMADWAKTPGQTTGVDPKEAERAANEAQRQLDEAKKAPPAECPKTTPQPKSGNSHGMSIPVRPSPYQNVGTTQTGPYTGGLSPLNPTPEARTAKQEYDAITAGWGGLGYAFAASDGCDQQQLQRYIAGLEDLARRARALAPLAREAGEFSTVNADQAQKLAETLQRHIDEAKQFASVDCPAGVRFKMNPWDGKILAIHNQERAAVGAQPLHWDPVLAAHANSYAQELARTGQLTHASREGRGIERENLGQGRMGWSPDQIIANEWTSEKSHFRAGIFPNICDGDWSICAHYSQEIWPKTTDLGCGYAVGRGFSWLVCRYSPGGNKDNQPVGYRDPSTYLGGPLVFNPTYSPILKAMRPVNPDKLEFGDETVAEWRNFENARARCSVPGMSFAIDKLKYYSQAAHEHSAEEHMKGNELASGSYDAMARQIDERVQDASLYRDACARNPYQYPERG